jgi:MoxR-like ATPase
LHTFDDAARSFRAFFSELREGFLERETLFTQIELALLCREHVLVTGPPGTAKSAIASGVLNRIHDEATGLPSLFAKQISELTVQTDLIGPVDFKALTETGRTEYLTEDGMLGATHAFLDEVFDGRDMLLRSILNVLHERELKHGRRVTPGKIECVIMTSNRYLSEVLARSPELLLAFADRLSFICFVPKAFARSQSRAAVLQRAVRQQRLDLRARLSLQSLDALQAEVDRVEVSPLLLEALEALAEKLERELQRQVARLPDYVPTKYFSHRSMVKAIWALKAAVVRDRIWRHPDRPLCAATEDLDALRHFFLLGGPTLHDTEALLKSSVDPRERAQLEILRLEHKAFDETLAQVLTQTEGGVARESAGLGAREDLELAEAQVRAYHSADVIALCASLRRKLTPGPRHPENRQALLSPVRLLVSAATARLGQGMAAKGEGRGGVQLHVSLRAVLELVREVPEVCAQLPALCEQAAAFCGQALEMIALSAESTAFENQITLEQLSGMALNLDEEMDGVHELLAFVAVALPELADGLVQREAAYRARAARALRARVDAVFPALARGKAGSSEEALSVAARRLADVEASLVALSADQAGLKNALLAPLARDWAREVLARTEFARIEEYAHALRTLAEKLRQEALPAGAVLAESRALLEERLAAHLRARAPARGVPELTPTAAVGGEAYLRYRQELSGPAQDGEYRGLSELEAAFGGDAVPGAPFALSLAIKNAVASADLESLRARVAYLGGWLGHLLQTLPAASELRSRENAEKTFDQLVKSRFPLLTLKEGELVRLSAALGALCGVEGEVGHKARALDAEVRVLGESFSMFTRDLLEVRGRL